MNSSVVIRSLGILFSAVTLVSSLASSWEYLGGYPELIVNVAGEDYYKGLGPIVAFSFLVYLLTFVALPALAVGLGVKNRLVTLLSTLVLGFFIILDAAADALVRNIIFPDIFDDPIQRFTFPVVDLIWRHDFYTVDYGFSWSLLAHNTSLVAVIFSVMALLQMKTKPLNGQPAMPVAQASSKCHTCGSQVVAASNFCTNCGTPLLESHTELD